MTSLLIFWIAVWVIFLIIEMLTTTFYGLALAIASFFVAVYVFLSHDVWVSLTQWIIFAFTSFLISYFLPRFLTPEHAEKAQWLDIYLGEIRTVKKVGEDFKVTLDGVAYIIDIDSVKSGDKVKLTARKGSIFHGEIVS